MKKQGIRKEGIQELRKGEPQRRGGGKLRMEDSGRIAECGRTGKRRSVLRGYLTFRKRTKRISPWKGVLAASSCMISRARSGEKPPVPAPISGKAMER